jgi:hypothetical protein
VCEIVIITGVVISRDVEINQQNALTYIPLYFLVQLLLHVSAKHCHPQGVTMFLSEPLQRQWHGIVLLKHVGAIVKENKEVYKSVHFVG